MTNNWAGIDLISLFKGGLFLETSKDFLVKSLNGFIHASNIEKSSYEPTRLKNKHSFFTADFLIFLYFPVLTVLFMNQ